MIELFPVLSSCLVGGHMYAFLLGLNLGVIFQGQREGIIKIFEQSIFRDLAGAHSQLGDFA